MPIIRKSQKVIAGEKVKDSFLTGRKPQSVTREELEEISISTKIELLNISLS